MRRKMKKIITWTERALSEAQGEDMPAAGKEKDGGQHEVEEV